MLVFTYVGDVLWIIALSIMAGASRDAWKRTTPQTRMPMQFRADGAPLWRARRNSALLTLPIIAFWSAWCWWCSTAIRRRPATGP